MSREHICPDCGQLHQMIQQCFTCETSLPDVAWWYHDCYGAGYQAGREWGDHLLGKVIRLVENLLRALDPTLPEPFDPEQAEKNKQAEERIQALRKLLGDLRRDGER